MTRGDSLVVAVLAVLLLVRLARDVEAAQPQAAQPLAALPKAALPPAPETRAAGGKE